MRCKKCKHHAIPLTEGLCYKCASDRLQTLKEYSSTELRDELARRNSEAEQKQAKTEASHTTPRNTITGHDAIKGRKN